MTQQKKKQRSIASHVAGTAVTASTEPLVTQESTTCRSASSTLSISRIHAALWAGDPTAENWTDWNGPERFESLYKQWCLQNGYDPHDLPDTVQEDVIAHHHGGFVTMIKMPTGEVVGEYEEKGLTAFEIEQARRAGDRADYFLQDARRRAERGAGRVGKVTVTKGPTTPEPPVDI